MRSTRVASPSGEHPVAAADGGKEMVAFQQAYEAAVARYRREEWENLIPSQIIQAIYEEMRRLDAEAAGVMIDVHLSEQKSKRPDSHGDAGMTDGSIVRDDDPADGDR
jgi:hypothetical protein